MSSNRYITPAIDENGQQLQWALNADQLIPAIEERWPDAEIHAPHQGANVLEFTFIRDGRWFTFDYHPVQQFLAFRDQDPLLVSAEVVRWFLDLMGPDVPVVYFDELGPDPIPVPRDATAEEIARDLFSAVL